MVDAYVMWTVNSVNNGNRGNKIGKGQMNGRSNWLNELKIVQFEYPKD